MNNKTLNIMKIKITENKLNAIIAESIKKVLKEGFYDEESGPCYCHVSLITDEMYEFFINNFGEDKYDEFESYISDGGEDIYSPCLLINDNNKYVGDDKDYEDLKKHISDYILSYHDKDIARQIVNNLDELFFDVEFSSVEPCIEDDQDYLEYDK